MHADILIEEQAQRAPAATAPRRKPGERLVAFRLRQATYHNERYATRAADTPEAWAAWRRRYGSVIPTALPA